MKSKPVMEIKWSFCKACIYGVVSLWFASLVLLAIGSQPKLAQANSGSRRVNIPYLGGNSPVPPFTPAVFWLGKISPSSNYADVRVYYHDLSVNVVLHIIDRRLWYDPSPSVADLTTWDAVSLFLDIDGVSSNMPSEKSYQFIAQLNDWQQDRTNWQAAYQGDGSIWKISNTPFTTKSGYRWQTSTEGGINTDKNNAGWVAEFFIPYNSLGLSGPPPKGTIWGLGIAIHDRDDAIGTSIPDQLWPENLNPNQPATWGQMHHGIPVHRAPVAIPTSKVTIRQGLNGASVPDGHVGGHTTCGANLWPDIYNTWGNATYPGYTQINIQNQWDLSDWPCFSKYYVTFPLDALPPDGVILSASLTMHLFGNAGGGIWGDAPDSYIQVLTVGEDWDEATLTWNNAPLAQENISGTWVHPMEGPLIGPGEPYTWDVSRALVEAYKDGHPLRLALYSADGDRHTGKYFSSSDADDWNAVARPTLNVIFGTPCNSPGIVCHFTHLPLMIR